MASTQYEIGRIAERCALSGEPLKPGDEYVAALIESEGVEGLERRDYSAKAWEAATPPPRLFACWRATVPEQVKSGKAIIDAASLLGLFETLGESGEAKQAAFRYVLALLLLRKRLLLPAGTRAGTAGLPGALLVRMKGSAPEEPAIEVIDPAMDESTVAEITEQLRGLLRIDA